MVSSGQHGSAFGRAGDDVVAADVGVNIDPGDHGEGADAITLNVTHASHPFGRVTLDDPADQLTVNIPDDVDDNIHMFTIIEQSGGGATSYETQNIWIVRTVDTVTELTQGQILGIDESAPLEVLASIDLGDEYSNMDSPETDYDRLNENPDITVNGTLTSQETVWC